MKVLFTCSDKPTISRNAFHRTFLQEKFHDTYSECISSGKSYPIRILNVLFCLFRKLWRNDIYYVSYMGHFLVLFLRIFTSKPIVFDFYLSIYDMLCNDRKLFKPEGLLGKSIYFIEKQSLHKADYIIVDTHKLVETLSNEYGVTREKFVRVPLTINEVNIYKKKVENYKEGFSVLYVGSYIPLHGTEVIIQAAKILQEWGEEISFLMIGRGPDLQKCQNSVKEHGLTNIDFKGFMSLSELNHYYNACDINLGLFNSGPRANAVVLNKTNDAFRVGKPHLTLRTEAMCEHFVDNQDIFYVDDIIPETLANRIVELKRNPELVHKVGTNALKSYDEKLSNAKAKNILENKIFSKLT